MTPLPLTFRDKLYLFVSVLMIILGLVMLVRLRFSWNMVVGWAVALGFVGVGGYRLRIACKALNPKAKIQTKGHGRAAHQ